MLRALLLDAHRHIRVDLSVALRTLEVQALLLRVLLEARPLPLRQPALRIRHLPGVRWVKVLWIAWLLLLALRDEDLGAAAAHLDLRRLFRLVLFRFLRHSGLDELLKAIVFRQTLLLDEGGREELRRLRYLKISLQLKGLVEVTIGHEIEVDAHHLVVAAPFIRAIH